MILYKTIDKAASVEQIIEKSKFIAHVSPANTKEEGDAFIVKIKTENKGATHNVPAMIIGDKFQIQWASDDGEPQGTSGAPIVQMLVSEGITNIAVVITRYFGGVKLGTGGLVRAYTSSAKLAIEAAGIIEIREMENFNVSFDYCYLNKLQNISLVENFYIDNIGYTDIVNATFSTAPENSENLENILNNVTNGTVKILNRKVLQTR
ncbi:MAG: YigZ family protein [Peptostreptococcaceae bacterium]|nr:YigZ family protein [Peptostreptococcaceae bacterium]